MKATHQPPTPDSDTGMTPADLLRSAALYLFLHGWHHGEFFDLLSDKPFPPACTLGAINICAHGRPILCSDDGSQDADTDAAITAARLLAASLDSDYASGNTEVSAIDIVSGFNDHDGRTIGEVIEALTEAADDWDRAHPTRGAR